LIGDPDVTILDARVARDVEAGGTADARRER
jgi:hypothetical protein